jgi:CheY-like chemotaxis protein
MTDHACVLVVEDDRDIREIVIETLTEEGYGTFAAANGQEALAYLTSAARLPGVILLDIMMPVMDGRTFRARQLEDPRLAGIPVVVMTADADVAAIALELRASLHLKKPVTLVQLFEVARRFCDSPLPSAG